MVDLIDPGAPLDAEAGAGGTNEVTGAEAEPETGGRAFLKLVILAAVLGGAFLAYRLTPLGELLSMDGVARIIGVLRESPIAPLMFVGIYAGATALAIPGTVLTLLGGAVFGLWWGVLFNSLGANLGANAAFWMSRGLGKDGVRRLLGNRAGAFDSMTRDHGFQGLLTMRLIPVFPFNALNFGSGLTGMSWGAYALATAVGIFPGTVVYTFFADALLQGSQEASREAWVRVLIAGLLLVALSLMPMMIKRFRKAPMGAAIAVFALLGAMACGPDRSSGETPGGVTGEESGGAAGVMSEGSLPKHGAFTNVLTSVLHGGRVDYAQLAADRASLDAYLGVLASVTPATVSGAEPDEALAFWINAYNACMLKRVVDHYPIQSASGLLDRVKGAVAGYPDNSVQQIDGVFNEAHCGVAGQDRSQDEIEHEILRPMGEPRIHFAINCAAMSCPPLSPSAYEAATVDAQLDDAVRGFVADSRHYALEDGVLRLNKVLDWFGEDFGGPSGLVKFFREFAAATGAQASDADALSEPDVKVEFFDYDWTLNDTAVEGTGG